MFRMGEHLENLKGILAKYRLLRWLFWAGINGLIFLFVFEISIYAFPKAIPPHIVARFPAYQRKFFAEKQQRSTTEMIMGDKYLYSLNATYPSGPRKFSIDCAGYRNPQCLEPLSSVDIVLLGDSLMIAENSDKDLGQLFREAGYRAYNLGMGGYSPLHYALSYDKYIIEQDVKHKYLVISFCTANDLKDLEEALDIYYERNLTYYEYINQNLLEPKKRVRLLTPIVIRGVVNMARSYMAKAPQEVENVTFDTPHGQGKLSHLRLETMGITYVRYLNERLGQKLCELMNGVIEKANSQGVKVFLVIMPNWEGIYGNYVKGYPEAKANIEKDYAQLESFFTSRLKGDVHILNAREVLAEATREKMLTGAVDGYHLNTAGVQVLFDYLRREVNPGAASGQ